jgi:hypothetical protein
MHETAAIQRGGRAGGSHGGVAGDKQLL